MAGERISCSGEEMELICFRWSRSCHW